MASMIPVHHQEGGRAAPVVPIHEDKGSPERAISDPSLFPGDGERVFPKEEVVDHLDAQDLFGFNQLFVMIRSSTNGPKEERVSFPG